MGPECHFPIQNIPFGIFRPAGDAPPRVGTAIGDQVRVSLSCTYPVYSKVLVGSCRGEVRQEGAAGCVCVCRR